ncbi:MAG: S8 family serine peptidase, partial [Halobacteria archaeon]|nr:S8 family serine peptidase [Halobacteria archaeon]
VDLAAPGQNVPSTVPAGTTSLSGTSMACPHVSGVAAQLIAEGMSPSEARQKMFNMAEDIGLGENQQGNGLVDSAAALGHDSSDDLS